MTAVETPLGTYDHWRRECPYCHENLAVDGGRYTRLVSIVDREKDCVVAYQCPACFVKWSRGLGEIIAVMEKPS